MTDKEYGLNVSRTLHIVTSFIAKYIAITENNDQLTVSDVIDFTLNYK